MVAFIYLSVLFLSSMLQVTGIPWPGPKPSQYPVEVNEALDQTAQAPKTTDPPNKNTKLGKRDLTPASSVCGWVGGNYNCKFLSLHEFEVCFDKSTSLTFCRSMDCSRGMPLLQ
jgi:hypothetical protein